MLMNEKLLAHLRKTYPGGTRVELVRMDDVQAPPIGTKGTVYGVDDTGFHSGELGQRLRAKRGLRY